MSILAGPRRRKQRVSVDPQNSAWKQNTEKFGQKIMEQMGWSEGKGLGKGKQGITENVRLKPNYETKGEHNT